MGIADLFGGTEKKEETAIQQINNLEEVIRFYVTEYQSKSTANLNEVVDFETFIWYLKGELLRKYMMQLESKDKEAKYFFKDLYFKDYVNAAIPVLYNYFEKSKQGLKYQAPKYQQMRWKYSFQIEQGQAADESLSKIEVYAGKLSATNQRSR